MGNMTSPNNDITSKLTDATIASVSTKWGMGGGTATSLYGWLTTNEAVVLIGLIITIVGFVLNGIFQYRRDRVVREEHELKKKLLQMELHTLQEEHDMRISLMKKGILPQDRNMNIRL